MLWGGRNLENRDDDGESVKIDGERVKEGVIGCCWDVVFVAVKRHIIESRELCGSPSTLVVSYWREI